MRILLLVILCLSVTSCSSWFKRRECNKTNWFTHGEKVAMSGKRLDEDRFIHECRKVEAEVSDAQLDRGFKKGMAKYCRPDTAFQTGRRGKFLSQDLCDGPGFKKLKARHREGVREYCRADNGFSAGATGEKYNFICPKSLSREFLREFNKGRKSYLEGEIGNRREEIAHLDREIRELNRERKEVNQQLNNVSRGGTISIRNGFRNIRITERTSPEERKQIRDDLQGDLQQVRSKIRRKQSERKTKIKEISDLKREMVKL